MAGVVERFPDRVQQLTQQAIEQESGCSDPQEQHRTSRRIRFRVFQDVLFHLSIFKVMDEPLRTDASQWLISDRIGPFGPAQQEKTMKMSWTKPTMCQVPAGLEISRYLPASMTPKK